MKVIKDVIKAADYRPNPHDRDFVVPVTTATLDHWVDTFGKMKAAGIGVPVPWEHPPSTDPHTNPVEWSNRRDGDPRNNAGWVDTVYRDGDTLMAVLDVPDECGEELVKKGCFVSPKFGGTWNDSLDRKWVNPIHHIALTTKPVAVNQSKEFKKADPTLAFSRAMCFSTAAWDQEFEWSQPGDDEMPDSTPDVNEAIERLLENPDVLARAAEKLGMTHEFSASFSPNPCAPGEQPAIQPDYAAQPEDDDSGQCDMSGNAIAMQVIHAIMNACTEGMKILAQQNGVQMCDDDCVEDNQPVPPTPQSAPQVTATPAVVSMSRDSDDDELEFSRDEFHHMKRLNAAMANKLTRVEQADMDRRVEALFTSGRCTRPDADGLKARVGKYEFSRQADQDNVLLLREIEILEKLPEGAAIKSAATTQFSRDSVNVVRNDPAFHEGDEISDERADEILAKEYGYSRK